MVLVLCISWDLHSDSGDELRQYIMPRLYLYQSRARAVSHSLVVHLTSALFPHIHVLPAHLTTSSFSKASGPETSATDNEDNLVSGSYSPALWLPYPVHDGPC
jgi:hypothetical protein